MATVTGTQRHLDITSSTLDTSGDIISNGDITIDNSTGDPFLKLKTTAQQYVLRIDQSDGEKFQIRDITNSLTPFTIDSSGNVGIGTDSPESLMHQHVSDSGVNYHRFTNSATGAGVSDGFIIGIGATEHGVIWNYEAKDLIFGANSTERLRIKSNGNVGIGTTSPSDKLHVVGDTKIEGTLFVENTNNQIRLVDSDSSGNFSVGVNTHFQIRDVAGNTSPVTIQSGTPSNTVYIKSSGNVGIGTTSPAVSLDIDATDAVALPTGTTAERPSSPAAGMIRYNTTDGSFEGYTTEWGAIGGSSGSGGALTVVSEQKSGDGSTADFTLSNTIASKNNVQVYIDGVYQTKDKYSTSGTTLTFLSGNEPPSGTNNVEFVHYVALSGTPAIEVDTLSGDGTTGPFDLTTEPATKNNLQVYIDGVYQAKANYDVSGTSLTFTAATPTGTNNIEVTHIKIS